MHAFLSAHVHWLWTFFHFVKGLHIYDWTTFWIFLALGVIQTLIAWEGGFLAVKGVEDKFPPSLRRRHIRFFTILALGLLAMTVAIGYLNDQGQHQAEVKTQESVHREEALQATLNEQRPLLIQAGVANREAQDAVRNAEATKTVNPEEASKLLAHIEQTQRAIEEALGQKAAVQGSAAAVNQNPLTQLSDAELSKRAIALGLHLLSANIYMSDVQDGLLKQGNYVGAVNQAELEKRQTDGNTRLNQLMNNFVQQDVPQVDEYRAELLRRLGTKAGPIRDLPPVGPGMGSINVYQMRASGELDNLARALSPAN